MFLPLKAEEICTGFLMESTMNHIQYIDITILKCHEHTTLRKVAIVAKSIMLSGIVRNPVIVDGATGIILDGHHRVAALKRLGAKKVPAYVVNYFDTDIKVSMRRKDELMKLIKQAVIDKVRAGSVFPAKTTKHVITGKPTDIDIKLEILIGEKI